MFLASPATAAMEICCVWWTTKEDALADAAPYTVRSVLVPAASLANLWRTRGGTAWWAAQCHQSFHEHQPQKEKKKPLTALTPWTLERGPPLAAALLSERSPSFLFYLHKSTPDSTHQTAVVLSSLREAAHALQLHWTLLYRIYVYHCNHERHTVGVAEKWPASMDNGFVPGLKSSPFVSHPARRE